MNERPLDLDTVKAFIRIAELGSFTLAADSLRMTQAAVSLKLKRLEDRLGFRLVERTPRHVELSARGAGFLEHARELMAAHERALALSVETRQRLTIGISDHVAGPELPALIARMNAQDPELLIEIRIGSSGDLLQSYDRRELDTVIARLHAGRDDGTVLAEEQLGWFAAPHWQHRADEPLPLATLAEPCGVRAGRQAAGRVGGAVARGLRRRRRGGGRGGRHGRAGRGRAGARMLPFGAVDVGPRLRLPEMPRLPVLLHARQGRPPQQALAALSAAFQGAIRG